MDVLSRIAANRRLLADFFDGLAPDQLDVRSLCDAWTVREVLGHLVMPFAGGMGSLLVKVVRARGSIDRASEGIASDLARRPVGELTALLRSHADQHRKAPGVGPMGQMTDGCVHLRDCARPLGLPDDVAVEDWGWGSGEEVTGPGEALAMAMTGRNAALDDLEGRGVRVLRDRTH